MSTQTVLLVEDYKPLLAAWVRAFRGSALVHATADLTAARVAITQSVPDLAIIDLHLPDGLGIELVRELRSRSSNVVIVLVTGNDTLNVRASYKAGANQVLMKPFSLPAVIDRVQGRIERAEQRTAERAAYEHRLDVLASCNGSIRRAAKILGVHRSTLQKQLERKPPPEKKKKD